VGAGSCACTGGVTRMRSVALLFGCLQAVPFNHQLKLCARPAAHLKIDHTVGCYSELHALMPASLPCLDLKMHQRLCTSQHQHTRPGQHQCTLACISTHTPWFGSIHTPWRASAHMLWHGSARMPCPLSSSELPPSQSCSCDLPLLWANASGLRGSAR